jgi:hypothetical protein
MKTPVFMSVDSAVRKLMPVATGCMRYFPDALLLVSWASRAANDKHRPGLPLAWDKSLSADEKDAEARHMLDAFRGLPPDPGLEELGDLGHLASKAWRALGDLQRACDAVRAEYERTLCTHVPEIWCPHCTMMAPSSNGNTCDQCGWHKSQDPAPAPHREATENYRANLNNPAWGDHDERAAPAPRYRETTGWRVAEPAHTPHSCDVAMCAECLGDDLGGES